MGFLVHFCCFFVIRGCMLFIVKGKKEENISLIIRMYRSRGAIIVVETVDEANINKSSFYVYVSHYFLQ